jgi:4-amino-4-deoxy-L-arabinose transferase-like glycosyltransferase
VSRRPSTALVWFGVLGGAVAWTAQFVAGLAFTFAQCNAPPGRWELPVQTWQSVLSIAGVVVGLIAVAVCVRLYRQTRNVDDAAETERLGEGTPPPAGRVNFLATTGLLVNALVLVIMIMTAIGAPLLRLCQQS